MRSVDVLVPTVRLDAGPLTAILDLDPPPCVQVTWIFVADDPEMPWPDEVIARAASGSIKLLRHEHNLGSAAARNTALEHSDAEWVLFLDDDVLPSPSLLSAYADAIESNPGALGFFGPTRFERARTIYQRGVEVSDILTFFRLAEEPTSLPWAPTSNVIVRGEAARLERFRTVFPKGGGGEDIDYLLRVSARAGASLSSVPAAWVHHPWWFGGSRDYSRFARWSFGDSLLHEMHPQHTYRSAPNAVEALVVAGPLAALCGGLTASWLPVGVVLVGIPIGELAAEWARLLRLKGLRESAFCVETVLIRSSNDVGRLVMQVFRLGRLHGLTERWDHFCDGEHIGYHQRWAAIKSAAHVLGVASVAWLFIS